MGVRGFRCVYGGSGMGTEGFGGYGWPRMGVDDLKWVWRVLGGCGGPEMGEEGLRWVRRA